MVTGGGSYIANGLYNADCITAMRTMPNECVNMVVTDPPYDIKNTKAGGGNPHYPNQFS